MTAARRETLLAAVGIRANWLDITAEMLGSELGLDNEAAAKRLRSLKQVGWAQPDGGRSACGWFKTWKITPRGYEVTRPLIEELQRA